MVRGQRGDSGEGPAGSADSLVLDGGNSSFRSPVDGRGNRDVGSGGNVFGVSGNRFSGQHFSFEFI